MNRGFINKLVEKIRYVEPSDIGHYLQLLSKEKGFLETVFNAILDGIIVTTPQDRILYLNNATCSFFGMDPSQGIGMNLTEEIPELELAAVATSGDVMSRDLEIFYPERRCLNFYVVPLMGEENSDHKKELIGRLIILRDITEERRAKQDTIESERFSAITLLAAGVAHEIGNPLNSLDIQLQLIERQFKRQEEQNINKDINLQKSISIARGEVARLDQIITKFLKAVRPTYLQTESSDFNKLILESVNFLRSEIENRGISVEIFPAKMMPHVTVDRDQIRQAIYNVIINSLQAMDTKGHLRVITGSDDTHVWVSIGDNGGGINPKIADKIFQPYVTTKKEGSGLGLLVVQRIVRAHGGEIDLKSAASKGVIFTIRIPRDDHRIRLLPGISKKHLVTNSLEEKTMNSEIH